MATTFNHFPAIANALDDVLGQVVRKTAFDLQGNMQKQIRANHQIDTGFMINSVYVRTIDENTYGETLIKKTTVSSKPTKSGKQRRLSKSQRVLKSRMDSSLLEEVEAPPDKHTAYVGVGAAYGWYQNYGTSRIPARPFVEPAIETTRPSFDQAISRVEEKLRHAQ